MLCYRCGRHTPEGSTTCQNCGQPLGTQVKASARPRRVLDAQGGGPYSAGDALALRYTVRAFLGQGPGGFVYRVSDSHPAGEGGDIALKVIHPRLVQSKADRAQLSRAVEASARMNHPGIARVFEYGEDGERVFFTMQLCNGLPLQRIIELRTTQRPFSLAECEPIFGQVCQALTYAHQFQAHGTLRPGNILVQPDEIRITDFALLQGLPRRPYLATLGTAAGYLAPEVQREDGKATAESDIYSLGVMLREMLTGEAPGAAPNAQIPPLVPAARSLIEQALSAASAQRFSSAQIFHDALIDALDDSDAGELSAPLALTDTRVLLAETQPADIEPETKPLPVSKKRPTLRVVESPVFSVGGKKIPAPRRPTPVGPVIINFGSRSGVAEARSLPTALIIIALGLVAAAAVIWARNPALFGLMRGLAASRPLPIENPAELPPPPPPELQPASLPGGSHDVPALTVTAQPQSLASKPSAMLTTDPSKGLTPAKARTELPAHDTRHDGPRPVVQTISCPAGMVLVPSGHFAMGSAASDEFHNFADRALQNTDVDAYCIDRFEFPNSAGALPVTNVTQPQAKALCSARGKRLCKEEEWERACKGPQNARFAYGNEFNAATCNVEDGDGNARAVQGSGQLAECRSGYGVMDLSGNVGEWTESRMGSEYVVKGGDAAHPDFASRCAHRSAMTATRRSSLVGVRCCTDAD